MNVSDLKLLLNQFDNDDLVVLSTKKEDADGVKLFPVERVMASKLKPDNGDDILCAIFWPEVIAV